MQTMFDAASFSKKHIIHKFSPDDDQVVKILIFGSYLVKKEPFTADDEH